MAVVITQTASTPGGASTANVVTYINAAIGTAAPDRIVVVAACSDSASLPQSATLDGVTMSKATNGNFGNLSVTMFYLPVAAGTTATVAITYNGALAANDSAIGVYAVTGGGLAPQIVGGGNGSTDMDASAPLTTGALTTFTNGGLLAAAAGATNTTTFTWSANVAADIAATHTGNFTYGTAKTTTAISAAAVTCTGSVNNQDGALGWLGFAPGIVYQPGVASPTLSGTTSTLTFTENLSLVPAVGSASLTTAAPIRNVTDNRTFSPDPAVLALSGNAYSKTVYVAGQYDETGESANIDLLGSTSAYSEFEFGLVLDRANLSAGDRLDFRVYANGQPLEYSVTAEIVTSAVAAASNLSITAAAPDILATSRVECVPAAASLSVSSDAPAVIGSLQPATANILLAGDAPGASIPVTFTVPPAALSLSASAPVLSTFVAGQLDETGETGSVGGFPPLSYTELEFGLVLDNAHLVALDILDFRVYAGGSPLATYSITPQIVAHIAAVINLAPPAASLTLSGAAPSVTRQTIAIPSATTLTLSSAAPTAFQNLLEVPGVASLTLSGTVSAVLQSLIKAPAVGSLTLSPDTPNISGAGEVVPASASLTLSSATPTVSASVQVPASALTLTGAAPVLSVGAPRIPAAGSLTLSALAAVLSQSQIIVPAAASLSLIGATPGVSVGTARQPVSASLTLTADAPIVAQTANVTSDPASASLILAGETPVLAGLTSLSPDSGSLALILDPPSIVVDANLASASGYLTLSADVPVLKQDIILSPAAASLILSGELPDSQIAGSAPFDWLVCASISIRPEVDTDVELNPELPSIVAMAAALEGKPGMRKC